MNYFSRNMYFLTMMPTSRKMWPITKKKISQFKTDPEDRDDDNSG